MIKINLATKKQSNLVDAGATRGTRTLTKVTIQDLPMGAIRKLLIAGIFVFALDYTWNSYQEEKLGEYDKKITVIQEEQTKINAELAKTRNDDVKRKQAEEDALVMQTKLDTINKLMLERQSPPQILLTIAQDLPKEVWLNELKIGATDVSIKGDASSLDDVLSFQKTLGESTYLTDVKLQSELQGEDLGEKVATFELIARRK